MYYYAFISTLEMLSGLIEYNDCIATILVKNIGMTTVNEQLNDYSGVQKLFLMIGLKNYFLQFG